MTTANERELRESEMEWSRRAADLTHRRLSRRRVLKGSVALALLSSGGMAALMGACGDDSGATATPAGTTTGGAAAKATATATPFAGVTGPWDTTGTPPYKQGLPDDVAKVPEKWKQYPWAYKYGPWRYNWNFPVTRGGQMVLAGSSSTVPAAYDVMVNGVPTQAFYNKLIQQDIREGTRKPDDLFTKAFDNDLAIGQEHNPDYTSWTFKLPPNVVFHNIAPVNGRKLTAADVVFSFQRHMDANVNRSPLRYVDKVTAVNDTTVRFDMKQPQLRFPSTLSSPHFPVFAKEAFDNQDQFKKQPIGTGPYVLKFSEVQNRSEWARNEQYWQVPPYKPEKYGTKPLPFIDTQMRNVYANIVATTEAFVNGKIDELPGNTTDPAVIKQVLQQVPAATVFANGYWSCCPLGYLVQFKNPVLQDLRVRQALSMGVDRQKIWAEAMQKTGTLVASPIPVDDMGSDLPPDFSKLGPNVQYNPDKAKALLKEAGITPPLKLSIYAGARTGSAFEWPLEATIFQWKQAGIVDATEVSRDAVAFTQDKVNKSFPDLLWGGGGALTFGFSLDSTVFPSLLSGSAANFGSVADAKLDALFAAWDKEADVQKGYVLAQQMNQQIIDNVDGIWIGNHGGVDVTQPWIHGQIFSPWAAINYIGLGNEKFVWIDGTAPSGRGGKPIA